MHKLIFKLTNKWSTLYSKIKLIEGKCEGTVIYRWETKLSICVLNFKSAYYSFQQLKIKGQKLNSNEKPKENIGKLNV